jgi:hypothetical protein
MLDTLLCVCSIHFEKGGTSSLLSDADIYVSITKSLVSVFKILLVFISKVISVQAVGPLGLRDFEAPTFSD